MFILQITFLLSGFTVWTQTPSEPGFGTAGLWACTANLHPQGRPCCPAPQPWAHLPVPQPGQTSRHYGCTHSRKKKKQGGDLWSQWHCGVPTGSGALLPGCMPTSVTTGNQRCLSLWPRPFFLSRCNKYKCLNSTANTAASSLFPRKAEWLLKSTAELK